MDFNSVETSILLLARLDAWIMTVLVCSTTEGLKGGLRQKVYNETFEKYLSLATSQIIKSLYMFVQNWEPEDLKFAPLAPSDSTTTDDGDGRDLDSIFQKTYEACVPVYIPSLDKAYLAIKADWFSQYVGNDIGIVHDCYIGQFSSDFKTLVMATEE